MISFMMQGPSAQRIRHNHTVFQHNTNNDFKNKNTTHIVGDITK